MNNNQQPQQSDAPVVECDQVHDHDLEKMVVANLMISYRELVNTLEILNEDCFHDPTYRETYRAIMAVYKRGDAPDMTLVSNQLAKDGSQVTGLQVTGFCLSSMQVLNLVPHAEILRDLSIRRRLWLLGYNMMMSSSNLTEDVVALHSEAKKGIDSLFDDDRSEVMTLKDSYKLLQERMLVNRNLSEGETYGTPTGFPALDRNGGLCGTDFIVVGAESSKGKTSFATALVMKAIEHGDGVAFYSMEMSPVQLTARIASMKTGISASRILYQRLDMDEIFKIDGVMDGINTERMYFDDRSTISLDSILTSIRQLWLKHGIKGAVVDYLQLIDSKLPGQNMEQARAECARRLKNLAKELDIWIIAISQLNRNDYGDIPTMARLRDSGQIAEAADNVLLIHRTDKGYAPPFDGIPSKDTAMVIIGKGRNIGTGEFICGFKPENTLFYPLSQPEIEMMKTRSIFTPDDPVEDGPRMVNRSDPF